MVYIIDIYIDRYTYGNESYTWMIWGTGIPKHVEELFFPTFCPYLRFRVSGAGLRVKSFRVQDLPVRVGAYTAR